MSKFSLLAVALLFTACGREQSVEEYNKQQAERADMGKPKVKPVKVTTALPGGTKVACDRLLDAQKVTEFLQEKEPVTIADQSKQEIEVTSLCSVRRGGELMDEKKQAELTKKTARLGVLAGDEICSIAVFCSIPADENQFKEDCKRELEKGDMKSNEAVGVFACIKITPKGPDDAFTYKFIDPDSRCVLRVRGGPSVNDEAIVQTCAKAALESIGPDSIKEPGQEPGQEPEKPAEEPAEAK